jgi:hypothetical protein
MFFIGLLPVLRKARIAKENLSGAYERPKKTKAARKGRARAAIDGLECSCG